MYLAMSRTLRFLLCFLTASLIGTVAAAQSPLLSTPEWERAGGVAGAPELTARAAVLVEHETGAVLFAKNPHLVVPAASLTKVIAIHAAMEASQAGAVDLDEMIVPPAPAWVENQAPGSSLMFLGPGQRLPVRELLPGLAISSGNDAAVALAISVDGTIPAFASRMNRLVRALGLRTSSFVEPSGIDPRNLITAYEYAAFLREHLALYPQLIDELYSQRSYTYPQEHNLVPPHAEPAIAQSNRNLLLGRYEGADGVKTGFIDESGYHLAASAVRDGRRLTAVVLGVGASSSEEGGTLRAAEAAALLDYGFEQFELLRFGLPPVPAVTVFRGALRTVEPLAPASIAVSAPRGVASSLTGEIDAFHEVIAPVRPGRRAGMITVRLGEVVLAEAPVILPEVPEGGFLIRMWDSVVLFFRAVFGGDRPPEGGALAPAAE
jgi:D-alanyl-D-alanine carboxypeptidase (penicillin-binding protein 5/6)